MTSPLKFKFRSKSLLPAFVLILAIVACECAPELPSNPSDPFYACAFMNPQAYAMNEAQIQAFIDACQEYVNTYCPLPADDADSRAAYAQCQSVAIGTFFGGQPFPNLPPYATAVPTSAPPPPQPPQPPSTNSCVGLRLTSPLDGMPNGVATFYWDPLASGQATYDITIMDENHTTLAVLPAANQTSVSGDVSMGVIGGQYQFWVRVSSYSHGHTCTDEHLIMRAAPDNTQPTPTPRRRGG